MIQTDIFGRKKKWKGMQSYVISASLIKLRLRLKSRNMRTREPLCRFILHVPSGARCSNGFVPFLQALGEQLVYRNEGWCQSSLEFGILHLKQQMKPAVLCRWDAVNLKAKQNPNQSISHAAPLGNVLLPGLVVLPAGACRARI